MSPRIGLANSEDMEPFIVDVIFVDLANVEFLSDDVIEINF